MPTLSNSVQSYKKYFKYTITLCKIYITNKHCIKKARQHVPRNSLITKFGSFLNLRKDTKNN